MTKLNLASTWSIDPLVGPSELFVTEAEKLDALLFPFRPSHLPIPFPIREFPFFHFNFAERNLPDS